MAETTLTVQQIRDLGLWEKVCDFKGWEYTILAEGLINSTTEVTFDSEFKKIEDTNELVDNPVLSELMKELVEIGYEKEDIIRELELHFLTMIKEQKELQ